MIKGVNHSKITPHSNKIKPKRKSNLIRQGLPYKSWNMLA